MAEAASFREATGANSNGLVFLGTPIIKDSSDEFKLVLQDFMNKYPEGPAYIFLLLTTHDAIKSITDSIEAVGPDPTKVKEFLKTYKSQGALGAIEYDENGDIKNISYVIKRMMEDGTLRVIGVDGN